MNRGILIAAVIAVLAFGVVFMLREKAPDPETESSAAPAEPRIVPRKNEPVPTPAKPVAQAAVSTP